MPRRPMSVSYMAWFFDGEGNIRVTQNGGLQVSLAQKGTRGQQVLNAIRSDLTLLGVQTKLYPPTPQDMHTLMVSRREESLRLCRLLLPYLHVKRTEVADHLRFFTLFPKLEPGSVGMRLRHREAMTVRRARSGF